MDLDQVRNLLLDNLSLLRTYRASYQHLLEPNSPNILLKDSPPCDTDVSPKEVAMTLSEICALEMLPKESHLLNTEQALTPSVANLLIKRFESESALVLGPVSIPIVFFSSEEVVALQLGCGLIQFSSIMRFREEFE